jgi:hypothetical protein
MNRPDVKDHEVPAEVCMAYAWAYGVREHMQSLTTPPDHDGAATTVGVWVEHAHCLDGNHPDPVRMDTVTVQVEGTNVRFDVTPAAARRMARLLTECAGEIDPYEQDEADQEAGS